MKKTVYVLMALCSCPPAFAADYFGMCKTELGKVAAQMSSYLSSQSGECRAELDKGPGERNNQAIGQHCRNANGSLLPLKNRAYAVCGQCRRLNDPRINSACTDNGISAFIEAVSSL